MNLSTHAIVFFGTFVCKECAAKIVEVFDKASTWPKRVMSEHWDDFQLRHIAKGVGGNRPIYQLFSEYQLESSDIKEKYNSKIFLWYRKKHRSLCDGTVLLEKRPPKTWGEAWDRTVERVGNKLNRAGTKTK